VMRLGVQHRYVQRKGTDCWGMRESLTWNPQPKQVEEKSLEEKEKIYEMTRGGEADRNGDRI